MFRAETSRIRHRQVVWDGAAVAWAVLWFAALGDAGEDSQASV